MSDKSRSRSPLSEAEEPKRVAEKSRSRSPDRDVKKAKSRSRSRDKDRRRRSRSKSRSRSRDRRPARRVSRSPVRRSPARRSRSPPRGGRRSRSPPRRSRSPRRSRRSPSPRRNRSGSPPRLKPGCQLFVAGFNFICNERDVVRKFEKYGRVTEVRIVKGPTGESRGFGFVDMDSPEDAKDVIRHLDGIEWNGRKLMIELAKRPRQW